MEIDTVELGSGMGGGGVAWAVLERFAGER
jgi:hypothetical protein